MDSTNRKRRPSNAHAHRDVFQARLPWEEMVKLNKGSIFIITETQFAIQSQVMLTTKLHGTSTCRRNNNAIFSDRAIFRFPTGRRIPATLIWPLKSIAGGCQSSEMAALLNSLSFAFANSFLHKYRVKYYDYIVILWCSGV